MSVPVYSSNKKNWFHIQPRLERLSGTPLASCPVSPVEPLRPPVVLRRALRPYPGELRWATAHSTTRTQSFLRSMATPPPSDTEGLLSSSRRGALSPEDFFLFFFFWSEYQISPHAASYCGGGTAPCAHMGRPNSTCNIYTEKKEKRKKKNVNTGRRGGNLPLLLHRLLLCFQTRRRDRLA